MEMEQFLNGCNEDMILLPTTPNGLIVGEQMCNENMLGADSDLAQCKTADEGKTKYRSGMKTGRLRD